MPATKNALTPAPANNAKTRVAALLQAALTLSERAGKLKFAGQVAWVYNPLDYAWAAHEQFIRKYGKTRKKVLLLGMNPGPFGMMQTGVPFGEVAAVRDWMGINEPVNSPVHFHPKRPIEGFACTRSEVSGRRLWGWAENRFGTAQAFFSTCFVVNYCPLVFLGETGRNLTPDKLQIAERERLQKICDEHLQEVIRVLNPAWTIGVGGFAATRLSKLLDTEILSAAPASKATRELPLVGQILHPSPASPLANRGWEPAVEKQFAQLNCL